KRRFGQRIAIGEPGAAGGPAQARSIAPRNTDGRGAIRQQALAVVSDGQLPPRKQRRRYSFEPVREGGMIFFERYRRLKRAHGDPPNCYHSSALRLRADEQINPNFRPRRTT